MILKKLDLDNFDSQLETYSLKAIRQQLNCLAANVNRLVDAVNDISEPEEEPVKYKLITPDLKPCPFCGGEADIDMIGYPRVRCTKCGASTDPVIVGEDRVQIAIDDWNSRSEDIVRCRDCCFYGWSIKSNYDHLSHWCNKNGGWHTDDYYCGDGVSEKIFDEREKMEKTE